jgi:hypothetical protein
MIFLKLNDFVKKEIKPVSGLKKIQIKAKLFSLLLILTALQDASVITRLKPSRKM